MTLEYKILWIEDKIKSIRGNKRVIERYLENTKGFISNVQIVETFDEFESSIGYDNLKNYDLLLIDLNLDEDDDSQKDGNLIIQNIRNQQIYTEIIFYSSQYEDLQDKLKEQHFVEGIFTSERKMIDTKAKQIIDVTLHKVQDVNNLRGLIMAEVAELDRLKEKILLLGSEKIPDKQLEKYTLKQVKRSNNKNINKINTYTEEIENVTYSMLLKQAGFIDANKKAYATGEILDKLEILEPINKKDFSDSYIKNILGMRNKFAHIEECDGEDEEGNSCKVIGDIPFTEKKCIEIRKEIRMYKKLLEEIYLKVDEA
jgi:CheY-like chemotaxis protein